MIICLQQRSCPFILKDALRIKRIAYGAERIESGVEGCQFAGLQGADFTPVGTRLEEL